MRRVSQVIGILIVIGFFLFQGNTAYADSFLKFHWKFDEGTGTDAGDASGNTPSYPGTLNGGPTWIPGGGLTFDGINDYTRTNSAIPGSMGVSDQAYTLSASVRVAPGEQNGNIIHISNGANGVGWCISMLHLREGKFRAIGWDTITNTGEVLATAPTVANTNEWYSIANTWSPESKALQLYINGELAASTPMDHYTAANASVYVFAGFSPASACSNTQGWFKGDIKDVRIYNRAITQQEAEENSNESLGIPPLSISAPIDTAKINAWSPAVSWGDANECQYSYDNSSWTTVSCSGGGADIPPPSTDGSSLHIYTRSKYTGEEMYAQDDVTFTYDTVLPVVDAGANVHFATLPQSLSSATASDATSGIASYEWTKLSGPGTVGLSGGNTLVPTITSVSQDGTYVLRLTVLDEAGNSAYSDVTLIWDTTDPDIQLTSFPDASTGLTSAQFGFDGTDNLSLPVSFQCKLDGASFESCTSPVNYSNLLLGQHTFTVRDVDNIGNVADDLVYSWTIVGDAINDKNGDGITDGTQTNVHSLTSSVTGQTVVLEASDGCVVDEANIEAEKTHTIQDPNYDYPQGLFDFTLTCDERGSTTTVKQYYYNTIPSGLSLRKYNPNSNNYFSIPDSSISNSTIYGSNVVVVSYSITDGGVLDTDGVANGTIVDPAGLAKSVSNGGLANTGQSFWRSILVAISLIGLSLGVSVRRTKIADAIDK